MKIFDKFIEIKQLPYATAGIIFILSLGFLHTNKLQDENQSQIVRAIRFSQMMSQSSDDLTNYARFYVATKNSMWREKFEEVLKVRAGELPDRDGKKISYVERVKAFNFKPEELAIYEQAVKLSNNLAVKEVEAFKIIQDIRDGKVRGIDEAESKAIDLVFGKEYQKYKSEIIETSEKFSLAVESRLDADDTLIQKVEWSMITSINILLLILVMALKHKSDVEKKPVRRVVRKKPTVKRRTTKNA